MGSDAAADSAGLASVAEPYWTQPAEAALASLKSSRTGLSAGEAAARLATWGPNTPTAASRTGGLYLLALQFRSPLVLILIFAAAVSIFVGEIQEGVIIVAIVLASSVLGFTQEYRASRAMEELKRRISQRARVLRDGREATIEASQIVPGDILLLSAGNLIPCDGVIVEAIDLNVTEAVLTGEPFPVVKTPEPSPAAAELSKRGNVVFAGTSVRSGMGQALAVETGARTEIAGIAASLDRRAPETEFSRGIRRFGYLMTEIMLAMVILVFVANLLLERPLIDSLLFSLALAVGITPELLPAIISVTLAHGARTMAEGGVIVRRLDAIENLGSMDLLCTDKTGTLTEGVIHLDSWLDAAGRSSADMLQWASLNASLQTGMKNPLDEAIVAATGAPTGYAKLGEIPYDFVRKRLSVVVRAQDGSPLLISKGAVENILEACSSVRTDHGDAPLDSAARTAIDGRFRKWSAQGYRVLGLGIRKVPESAAYGRAHEQDLTLAGFLLFQDPPKKGVKDCLAELARRGVTLKIISGDNRYVAAHVAQAVGLRSDRIMTGRELATLTAGALAARCGDTDIFAEIDPNQKERIIDAFRRRGRVVGYLGDGINDAPALQAADVGISVDGAVDVAREAADMILLRQDLEVLARGVDDGRRIFANTMKYIITTTSANFGNMISMAAASLLLPFLPLLAKQILLNNLLSDIPSLAIATDNIDAEQVRRPGRWDIGFIRRFMVGFGLLSSIFDFATFGFLILLTGAGAAMFQTGWFVESLLTELVVLLVVRTRKRFWKSRPGSLLVWLTAGTALLAIAIPYLPGSRSFGFVPLPLPVLAGLIAITMLYALAAEAAKHWFGRRARAGGRSEARRLRPPA